MSLEDSVEAQVGSFNEDHLKQFIDKDDWYFSDSESEVENSEDESSDQSSSQSFEQTPWTELCTRSIFQTINPTTATRDSTTSSEIELFIESILSQLGSHDSIEEDDDESNEMTDSVGGQDQEMAHLLEMEGGDSLQTTPANTIDRRKDKSDDEASLISEQGVVARPKYYRIATELLTSERTYIQGIRLLEKVLHDSIRTARRSRKAVLPESYRKRIFLNVGEIHALNMDLLNELESRMSSWDSKPVIADIFVQRAPFFKLYSMYTSRIGDAQIAFSEATQRYKAFADLVQLIENSALCKGLPLSSYMLYPIQRIPRYRLLLEDYLKHLPEDHPDVENSKIALGMIYEVAQHLNDRIKDLEQQAIVVKIQKMFVGRDILVVPGRQFLLRGPTELVSGRKLNKRKHRVLFLFSDVLIIAKILHSYKFKIKHKIVLRTLQVSSMHSKVTANTFCIFTPEISKPFRFCARNNQERDKFVKCIKLAISRELEKNKTFTMQRLQQISDPLAMEAYHKLLQDPSFVASQPSWLRFPRKMVVSPTSSAYIEDVDTPAVALKIPPMETIPEMEFIEEINNEDDDDNISAGAIDCTLSNYVKHQRGDGLDQMITRWFVLTPTSLVAYDDHLRDEPCFALTLENCSIKDSIKGDDNYIIKIISPFGHTHTFKFDNEYDYMRWNEIFQKLLRI